MIKDQFSISEAKNQLPAIIHGIESGKSTKLTRHGKPVAVLLSITEYESLKQKKNKGLWKSLIEFRRSMIVDETSFDDLRDSSKGRDFSF